MRVLLASSLIAATAASPADCKVGEAYVAAPPLPNGKPASAMLPAPDNHCAQTCIPKDYMSFVKMMGAKEGSCSDFGFTTFANNADVEIMNQAATLAYFTQAAAPTTTTTTAAPAPAIVGPVACSAGETKASMTESATMADSFPEGACVETCISSMILGMASMVEPDMKEGDCEGRGYVFGGTPLSVSVMGMDLALNVYTKDEGGVVQVDQAVVDEVANMNLPTMMTPPPLPEMETPMLPYPEPCACPMMICAPDQEMRTIPGTENNCCGGTQECVAPAMLEAEAKVGEKDKIRHGKGGKSRKGGKGKKGKGRKRRRKKMIKRCKKNQEAKGCAAFIKNNKKQFPQQILKL